MLPYNRCALSWVCYGSINNDKIDDKEENKKNRYIQNKLKRSMECENRN